MTAPQHHPYGPPSNAGSAPRPPSRRRGPWRWFAEGGWYFPVIVLSAGILAFVPFVHAAATTRRPLMWLWAVLYTAAVVVLIVVPDRGGLLVALTIVAAVHAVVLRRQVWPRGATVLRAPSHVPAPTGWPAQDAAVAAALAARSTRDEARRLAASDPLLARELRIGRPDLPRTYHDGGLVDLNGAPPRVIAESCGIDLAVATRIADARTVGVPFSTVDDVFSLVDIPFPLWGRIRDRAVVITG